MQRQVERPRDTHPQFDPLILIEVNGTRAEERECAAGSGRRPRPQVHTAISRNGRQRDDGPAEPDHDCRLNRPLRKSTRRLKTWQWSRALRAADAADRHERQFLANITCDWLLGQGRDAYRVAGPDLSLTRECLEELHRRWLHHLLCLGGGETESGRDCGDTRRPASRNPRYPPECAVYWRTTSSARPWAINRPPFSQTASSHRS